MNTIYIIKLAAKKQEKIPGKIIHSHIDILYFKYIYFRSLLPIVPNVLGKGKGRC